MRVPSALWYHIWCILICQDIWLSYMRRESSWETGKDAAGLPRWSRPTTQDQQSDTVMCAMVEKCCLVLNSWGIFIHLCIHLSIYPPIHSSICLSTHHLSIHSPICPHFVYPLTHLHTHPPSLCPPSSSMDLANTHPQSLPPPSFSMDLANTLTGTRR